MGRTGSRPRETEFRPSVRSETEREGTTSLALVQADAPAANPDIAALKAEVERLKGMVPDQSHAMKDVACHFTNLWFAAKAQNWPLADFYLAETRSHLRWAVRIIPVRQTPQGQELKLADLLDPMDKSVLKELQATIAAKDSVAFRAKYEQTLSSCSCLPRRRRETVSPSANPPATRGADHPLCTGAVRAKGPSSFHLGTTPRSRSRPQITALPRARGRIAHSIRPA